MEMSEEQRVFSIRAELLRIETAVEAITNGWDQHVGAARAVISFVDSSSLMQNPNRTDDQIFIVSRLQRLAYYDADSGGVRDIADWCVTQWLAILQRDEENIEALTGTQSSLTTWTPFLLQGRFRNGADQKQDWAGDGYRAHKTLLLGYTAMRAVRQVA